MNSESLTARITRLEAEMATVRDDRLIRDLLARHDYCLDARRDKDWLALWTPDGVYDLMSTVTYPDSTSNTFREVWAGTERLTEFITSPVGHHRPGFYGHSMHTASHNLVVEVSNETAVAHSYSILFQESNNALHVVSAGSNIWKLRNLGGRWLLSERRKRQVGGAEFPETLC
jgi:SnoaL-like domain